MATYVNDLRLKEITTGDESGTWGTSTNTNLELIAEAFSFGTEAITTNADTHTTTVADGATDPGRSLYLKYTGTLDSACTITLGPNTISKVWIIENATSGSQNIIISQGSGANVTIGSGKTKVIYSDGAGSGAAIYDAFANLATGSTLTVGAGVAEDTKIVFDGNAQDFYIGLDDSVDDLIIGKGSVVGTTPAITIDENLNVAVAGTVDGRDLATDGTKLDGIEAGATTDMTNAEIRSAVEAASDSNVFTDADHTKLNGIAASATNVTNNNQLTNGAGYVTSSGVTSVATSTGLSGGTITSSGTISLATDQRFNGTDVYVGDAENFIHFDSNNPSFGGNETMLFAVGSSSTEMAINTSGNLYIAGTLTQNYSFSDERLKTDINEITSAESLEKIVGLSPVNFKWTNATEEWVDKTQIGLIAQSVESIVPEVVREDYRLGSTEKYKIVQYENLIPLLIGAIKELKAKVDALENG
jgi:hypothetical protein